MLRTAGVILGLLAMIYIGYQIWHKMTLSVKCESATPYTYTVKRSGEGYIFRKEIVIPRNQAGSLIPTVATGEKVSTGSIVANVYSSAGEDAGQRLADIDKQIALLTPASGSDLTNKEVSKLDGETYDIIAEIRKCAEQGKYAEALSHKMNLITKVNRRNAASGVAGSTSSQLNALKAERDEITSKLGALLGSVTTPCSGWYYPETDGYEAVFSSSLIDNLTYDDFKSIVLSTPADTSGDGGKMVTDPSWYFVCELDRDSLASKVVGDEYTVHFPHNKDIKLSMTLVKISEGEDVGIAVFKSDKTPDGFDFARMQSYELIENEYTGFKIPKSAVRIKDGQMGVYVLTGEVVHFRRIEVMIEYENNYLVSMDHEEKEEETAAPSADNDGVAQSPEWSPDDTTAESGAQPADTASGADSAAPSGKADSDEPYYKWLGLNENVIISGKGLSDGKVITNMN